MNSGAEGDGFDWAAPVASFPPNGYGLFDMAGNVSEWCADRGSADELRAMSQRFPLALLGNADMSDEELEAWRARVLAKSARDAELPHRVGRGGSWMLPHVACTRRFVVPERNRNYGTGFRIAISLPLDSDGK